MPRKRNSSFEKAREEHWAKTVKLWTEARNTIPREVMEFIGEFHATFFMLAEQQKLSPPQVTVALSTLFAPIVMEHNAHPPPDGDRDEWLRAIYGAIVDSIVVAHALLVAVDEGRVVADHDTETLRGVRMH